MCPTNHLASPNAAAMLAEQGAAFRAASAHYLGVDAVSSVRRMIGELRKEQLRHIRVSDPAAAHARSDGYIVKPFNALTPMAGLEHILARQGGKH